MVITRTTKYEDLPDYLNVHETAAYLDLTAWTVYQLVARREIKHRRIGKSIFIPKEELHKDKAEQHVAVAR